MSCISPQQGMIRAPAPKINGPVVRFVVLADTIARSSLRTRISTGTWSTISRAISWLVMARNTRADHLEPSQLCQPDGGCTRLACRVRISRRISVLIRNQYFATKLCATILNGHMFIVRVCLLHVIKVHSKFRLYRGSVCSLYKLTGSADKAEERIRAAMRCECVQCIYFTFMLFLNR